MSDVVNWRLGLDDSFQTERRAAVSGHPTLCGIDYVEVEALADGWNLLVHFVPPARAATAKAAVPGGISPACIRITMPGGEAAPLRVVNVSYPEAGGDVLTVQLCAIGDAEAARPMGRHRLEMSNIAALDPLCATATFSLASASRGLLGPGTTRADSTDRRPSAEIDYLAKDYASFRRLMFDHLSLHAPQWRERHAADFGVALVEVMAYAADYLSHYQDAVATESYLGTARRRESVRRHARLLDYPVHDGCNGRVWIQFQVDANEVPLPLGSTLLTRVPTHGVRVPTQVYREQFMPGDRGPRVFETMHAATLSQEHNEIPIYTWGARQYALDKGTTAAALEGEFPRLKAGDVLVIEEVRGPLTGPPAEARRHAVRLSAVRVASDP